MKNIPKLINHSIKVYLIVQGTIDQENISIGEYDLNLIKKLLHNLLESNLESESLISFGISVVEIDFALQIYTPKYSDFENDLKLIVTNKGNYTSEILSIESIRNLISELI